MTRFILRTRPFVYGLVIGVIAVITANSLGQVIMVQVMPPASSVIMGAME